ncbi:site-specific integrase (plasmid) [Lichenicola cladoniae]|uniref:Site-specific integrase n=1 Tax=Lichenicola cladoniae TaxID=1484109 RepID=A0A6M8HZP0_9PROT|nr:site-specific integrase [Lichenicola cladoniae]NPD69782.1 site-specific integrase [Acetobacteraceae bacterium]QKE94044.1 site-specific integrase [Lichenicola cladoniae]
MDRSERLTEAEDGPSLPALIDGRDAGAELVQVIQAELAAAASYAEVARAASTRSAYAQDWRVFVTWCVARTLEPLPADPRAVAVFLASEAARGCAPMTIGRRLAAIGHVHRQHGLQPPQGREGAAAIVEVMAGIRRSHGKPPARKSAADADVMRDLLRAIVGDDIRSVRDRALLAIGMAGAFRRSELVALQVAQITREARGLRVQFGRTKTDQDGSGQVIAIPYGRRIRPVQLLEAWLAQTGISEGFVFRKLKGGAATDQPMSDRAVARVVQARVAAAGYDPTLFAGHSLRAGFITSGARAGASIFKLKEVSRHISTDVLAGYVRDAQIFEGHAGEGFL